VVAVGGYGRRELSPHSDIDLLLIVPAKSDLSKATTRGLLYPLWDAGFQVGHAVRSAKQAIERCHEDLHAATSLLSARYVAGDREGYDELIDRRTRYLARDGRALLKRIAAATKERHRRAARAGWMLAPDIKEDIGGLRDAHRVHWARAIVGEGSEVPALLEAERTLLAVREVLHSLSKRKSDRIHIELQPDIALRLGLEGERGADELMSAVHTAARAIEHTADREWDAISSAYERGPRRSGSVQRLDGGVVVRDGVIGVTSTTEVRPFAIVAAKAELGRPLDATAYDALRMTDKRSAWSAEDRRDLLGALRGEHVVEALEVLDVVGWERVMPEWLRVRGLAQHDPYHRFTVDGHLFEAVREVSRALADDATAATAAHEAGDLDPLYMAALLHDIGKGSGEDHSVAGARLAEAICRNMGFDERHVTEIATLVRHHLLLVDTATRRDLDDGAVIESVATTIPDGRILRLLLILSIADGRATGPDGWNDWKATLVRDLYRKVLVALETGAVPGRADVRTKVDEVEAYEPSLAGRVQDVLETLPPSYLRSTSLPHMVDEVRLLLQRPGRGEVRWRVDEGLEPGEKVLTICTLDRPGTLARAAGVLALHRISVLRAHAFSTTDGMALERFIVRDPAGDVWEALGRDMSAAYSGRLALEARIERKISDYESDRRLDAEVRVLNEASEHSSIVEVRTLDALGILYAITSAIAELDLDIHVAKVDTLGERIVDTFYVRTPWNAKLEEAQVEELRRAIEHRVARLFSR